MSPRPEIDSGSSHPRLLSLESGQWFSVHTLTHSVNTSSVLCHRRVSEGHLFLTQNPLAFGPGSPAAAKG